MGEARKISSICVMMFSIVLGFAASGMCEGLDCTLAPVENLEPCGPYISGSSSKPTPECCSGARSWENFGSGSLLCECIKSWPGRMPFPLIPKTIARLRFECGLSDRYSNVVCCIFDKCP